MPILKAFLKSLKKIFKKKRRIKKKKRRVGKRKITPAGKSTRKRIRSVRKKASSGKRTISARSSSRKKYSRSPKRTKTRLKLKGRLAASRSGQKTTKTKLSAGQPKTVPVKEVLVGEITHYFSKIEVCVIKVTGTGFKVGDRLHIKGGSSDFIQTVKSLQVESQDVPAARKGQLVGLKIIHKAGEGARVFKL